MKSHRFPRTAIAELEESIHEVCMSLVTVMCKNDRQRGVIPGSVLSDASAA